MSQFHPSAAADLLMTVLKCVDSGAARLRWSIRGAAIPIVLDAPFREECVKTPVPYRSSPKECPLSIVAITGCTKVVVRRRGGVGTVKTTWYSR